VLVDPVNPLQPERISTAWDGEFAPAAGPETIVERRICASWHGVDGWFAMLDFLFHKKRDEVKRVLHGRVNRAHARSISFENLRQATRGTLTEVVWVVPCTSPEEADYSRVFPAVSRDLCTEGVGIVHDAPIAEPWVIIGLRDETNPRFIACTPKHCTPLGYGFYHIGLFAEAVVLPGPENIEALCAALERFDGAKGKRREAAVAP
jgi:hypothetical protein